MNLFAKVIGVVAVLVSVQSFAQSRETDAKRMYQCGGYAVLNQAATGDLSLKLEGMSNRCNSLRFYDVTSGRTLRQYDINGTSYTLSKSMQSSLSSDCRVGVTVSGAYARENFDIVLDWCAPKSRPQPSYGYSYQLSQNNNCKLMKYGQYANKLVEDAFCSGARSRNDVVSYEFSNAGNCKRMINNQFSQQLVADRFCTDRHQ